MVESEDLQFVFCYREVVNQIDSIEIKMPAHFLHVYQLIIEIIKLNRLRSKINAHQLRNVPPGGAGFNLGSQMERKLQVTLADWHLPDNPLSCSLCTCGVQTGAPLCRAAGGTASSVDRAGEALKKFTPGSDRQKDSPTCWLEVGPSPPALRSPRPLPALLPSGSQPARSSVC